MRHAAVPIMRSAVLGISCATALAVAACSGSDAAPSPELSPAGSAGIALGSAALDVNDVSILFPLPKSSDVALLLGPAQPVGHSVLLPQDVLSKMPPLIQGEAAALTYPRLRV